MRTMPAFFSFSSSGRISPLKRLPGKARLVIWIGPIDSITGGSAGVLHVSHAVNPRPRAPVRVAFAAREGLTGPVRSHAGAASLVVAARSAPLRRAELAWGGLVAAEWAHFVALGVFAYRVGGTSAVGIAGVARMLPAAVLAPFAASLADRFRRERFLLAIAVIGATALAVSALGALADERYTVVAAAAVVGISSTLFRPALQALLPSLASTPQELVAANSTTSVLESAGTVVGPIAAAALVATAGVSAIFATGAATLVLSAVLLGRLHVEP